MSLKMKKFEKMIRGDHVPEQKSYDKQETINEIKFNELEALKQRIFVNSLNHIEDDVLRKKCSDITTHYRLFKDDESHYKIKEFSDGEKDKFDKCIEDCIKKECALITKEKDSVPADLLKLIESEPVMPDTIKNKLNNMLTLLNKYTSNQKEIQHSILTLLDSSYINILEAQNLSKKVDALKANSSKLQSDIINKFSCSKELFDSLEKYYNAKVKTYESDLAKFEELQKLQDKYELVDGPQFKDLVKKFKQTQEIIKIKTEMLNSY
ncbi:uncharacterized protein LOC112601493 [Melanaphis sacchari]|uniref:uncharacterized protein LOC112601493 n=1 Tax=Melanaphis sacchari TaxID=742174 RepID=UPI000DC1411B|nr:uncharacterized protein LOC112601493 [Melanaphis sacchari]